LVRVKSLTTNFCVSRVIKLLLIKLTLVCTSSWLNADILPLMGAFIKTLKLWSWAYGKTLFWLAQLENSRKKCYFSELSSKRFRSCFPEVRPNGKFPEKTVTSPNCLLRGTDFFFRESSRREDWKGFSYLPVNKKISDHNIISLNTEILKDGFNAWK